MSRTLPGTRDVLFMMGGAVLSALLFAGSAMLAARATAPREAQVEATVARDSPNPAVSSTTLQAAELSSAQQVARTPESQAQAEADNRLRDDRYLAQLQAQLNGEAADEDWAATVSDVLLSHPVPTVSVTEIRCAQTLCTVVLEFAGVDGHVRFFQGITLSQSSYGATFVHYPQQLGDGRFRAVAFVTRWGAPLPTRIESF
jgi:hypothetical protein